MNISDLCQYFVLLVKCTKPANIRLNNSTAGQLTLIWDLPKDVPQDYQRNLIYWIRVVGSGHGVGDFPKLIKVTCDD